MPTASTGLVRMLQLVLLLALSRLSEDPATRDSLVVGFGLIASFAMMTDSGAGNYLLSIPFQNITRHLYLKAVGLHSALAVAGSAAAILFLLIPTGGEINSQALLLLIALAAAQVLDSIARIVRTPYMPARGDFSFALPDFVLFALKVPIIGLAFFLGSLVPLVALPAASLLVAGFVFGRVQIMLRANPTTVTPARSTLRILEFGVTGALSALLTQSPLLVASTMFSIEQLAELTIAYRLIQALDLLPGTLSLQLIPRARDHADHVRHIWLTFVCGGTAIAVIVVLLMPLVEVIFAMQFTAPIVFIAIAASFAWKSGNYAIVAFLMGLGQIRMRFWLTLGGCAVAVLLSYAAATFGIVGVSLVPFSMETLFAAAGLISLHRTSRPGPPSVASSR